MSQPCAITKCKRVSRAPCDCCQQNICLQHLIEHNASLLSQLNPLTDEINAVGDRLEKLNIQKALGDSRRKLEEWRDDCHQKIDRFFEQKCQELDVHIEKKVRKQRAEIMQVQSKMAELIQQQETTRQDIDLLTSTIRQLEENMMNIEKTCFQIHIRPLVIEDSSVDIRETNEHEIDLSSLSPAYKTINRSNGSSGSIVSNDRYLLIHQNPNLCLVDREMNIVKQILWSYEMIYDMCWSSTLNRFIIIEENNVFLLDENTMSIENVHQIEKQKWSACTCSDISLFLSTAVWGSTIMKFRMLPSIELVKQWKSPLTCGKDEAINGIIYNRGTLAMLVKNKSDKSIRMELKSVETFVLIWSLRLDILSNQSILFDCCLLTCDEWLVADNENKRLLQIGKDGKVKKTIVYGMTLYSANLFGSNVLAISASRGVHLYKF